MGSTLPGHRGEHHRAALRVGGAGAVGARSGFSVCQAGIAAQGARSTPAIFQNSGKLTQRPRSNRKQDLDAYAFGI
jgi:hypothetical protein